MIDEDDKKQEQLEKEMTRALNKVDVNIDKLALSVVKFVLFGATGVVLWFCLSLVLPLEEDTFYDMNPLLAGF